MFQLHSPLFERLENKIEVEKFLIKINILLISNFIHFIKRCQKFLKFIFKITNDLQVAKSNILLSIYVIHASIHSLFKPSFHHISHQSFHSDLHSHTHPSITLFIHPCIYLSPPATHLYIHPSIHLSTHSSIHSSFHPPTYLSLLYPLTFPNHLQASTH